MDWTIAAVIGAASLNYLFTRNLKSDLTKRADQMDEKIFFLATGRKIEDAILENRKKRKN